ncbi:MAG: addiction module toxin RelE [Acidobacteriia bacterium]|nr:addiction module toxin RelE [Terriglobia bacterium]MYG04578.1 addiction module toxin RelE [Terriglobia bacterium]MYK10665.1 addiction module toxin RelE [Terriglobia bacterium]
MTPILITGVALQTVVETPGSLAAARGVLSEDLRATIVNTVAENPETGVPLGGGIRKVRIALPGRGKRGGARVVFLFAGDKLPVSLLTVFSKNEKASLSVEEGRALIQAAKSVVADYRRAS